MPTPRRRSVLRCFEASPGLQAEALAGDLERRCARGRGREPSPRRGRRRRRGCVVDHDVLPGLSTAGSTPDPPTSPTPRTRHRRGPRARRRVGGAAGPPRRRYPWRGGGRACRRCTAPGSSGQRARPKVSAAKVRRRRRPPPDRRTPRARGRAGRRRSPAGCTWRRAPLIARTPSRRGARCTPAHSAGRPLRTPGSAPCPSTRAARTRPRSSCTPRCTPRGPAG